MIKSSILLILSFIILVNVSLAQDKKIFAELSKAKYNTGKIHINQDASIRVLMNDYILAKKEDKGLEGYRVQIYFGSGHTARESATNIRNSFVSKHKEIPAHVLFEDPNFKVRVGDFRTKSEALKVLINIEGEYKGAYIVNDFIEFPDFK